MKKGVMAKNAIIAAAVAVTASTAGLAPLNASAALSSDTKSFLQDMGAAWNLGNSLDANSSSGLSAETSWSNPKTTKQMIEAVHDAGFNTVRIPVSWGTHVDGNYTIESDWLARVKEVVDYAYNDGMYVIINIHHDTTTDSSRGYYPDEAHKSSSKKYVKTIWEQVADEFKNYDEHLIFETLNEPRLTGSWLEWQSAAWSSDPELLSSVSIINELNQTAVDAIRSKGGKNKTRYIMAPGYSASPDSALHSTYKLPSDPVSSNKHKILVSVHAYRPYDLCLGSGSDITSAQATQFTNSGKNELNDMFNNLNNTFLSKGIGVVIGEMGISNKNNNDARTAWASHYYGLSKKYSIPCALWDNNSKDGSNKSENHWHFNRKTCKWGDPDVIHAIMDAMGISGVSIPVDDGVAAKADQKITIDPNITKTYGDSKFTLSPKSTGNNKFSYSIDDTSVAAVSSKGEVTIKKAGTAKITVTALENESYRTATATVTLTVQPKKETPIVDAIPDQTYTGSEIRPKLTVKIGAKVIGSSGYSLDFANNYRPGVATVRVTLTGNYTGYTDVNFNIISDGTVEIPANIPGDINGDTQVNIKDVIYLQKVLNGDKPTIVEYCDVNGDKEVNVKDVVRLQKMLNGD